MLGPASLVTLALLLLAAIGAGAWGVRSILHAHRVRMVVAAFACSLLVAGALGIQVNRTLGYADSWAAVPSLMGIKVGGGTAVPLPIDHSGDPLDAHTGDSAWDATFTSNGVKQTSFTGPVSKITQTVRVWVPPTYSPHDGVTYRVIVMLHGYPGNVKKIPTQLRLDARADQLGPTIVVMPDLQVDSRGPDCIDLEGRPRVGSWVTRDVVGMIRHNFPNTSADRMDWTIAGASAGGYCAMALGALYPTTFGNVVGMSPYDVPSEGLWISSPNDVQAAYAISALEDKQRSVSQRIMVTGTTSDPSSTDVVAKMSALTNPKLAVATLVTDGGHNWKVWGDQFPDVIKWVMAS